MLKHIVLFLDIDNTLINFKKCAETNSVVWIGGSPEPWLSTMEGLEKWALFHLTQIHFGIASFKRSADWIADAVVSAFKDKLDPRFIFYTNSECKVKSALSPTQQIMGPLHGTCRSDIWILDDQSLVIETATENGYGAMLADTKIMKKSKELQQDSITELFSPLRDYINECLLDSGLHKNPTRIAERLVDYCFNGQYSNAEKLLQLYPDIDKSACGHNGYYAIHFALLADKPDLKLIKLLLDNNHYIAAITDDDQTVLTLAIRRNHSSLVKYFIDHYADRFTAIQLGKALCYLITAKEYTLAHTLLERRPDTSRVVRFGPKGDTVLHLALREDNPDETLIKALATNHPCLTVENNAHQTPYALAKQQECSPIILFILQYRSTMFKPSSSKTVANTYQHPQNMSPSMT